MKGVVVAGTGSGVGKTSVATGLMSRLSDTMSVQAFKAGPDFIDPMYHTAVTGRPSRNLDTFMMDEAVARNLAGFASEGADVCVVEGVRGLYEGFSGTGGRGSTADVAKLLGLPVLLVVDARSITRSAAAIVNGFRSFDPDVRIAGVVLNNVSGPQHRGKLAEAFRTHCPDVEVVGMIPRSPEAEIGRRYLGLVTGPSEAQVEPLRALTDGLDLDAVMRIAESAEADFEWSPPYVERDAGLRAAVPMDDSFCFYYRENIECLEASGFRVGYFRPTDGDPLPDADLYYLGGGYPELRADDLEANRDFTEGLAAAAADGRVVVGECGGLMAMCRTLTCADGSVHGMSGVLDAEAVVTGVRHGPTYVAGEALEANPAFSGGVRGHEYHYSDVRPSRSAMYGFRLSRGAGVAGGMDGIVEGSAVGSYMHQHALSQRDWAGRAAEAAGRRP